MTGAVQARFVLSSTFDVRILEILGLLDTLLDGPFDLGNFDRICERELSREGATRIGALYYAVRDSRGEPWNGAIARGMLTNIGSTKE